MFKINRRTDYAVRVMLFLARAKQGTRVPTQTVQREMQIPSPFLRRIIADLARVGLIHTFVGPNGGVELGLPAETIQLRHIWEAIDGPILVSDCSNEENACPLETGCPVNRCWIRLQRLILQELERTSLAALAEEEKRLPTGFSIGVINERFLEPTVTE